MDGNNDMQNDKGLVYHYCSVDSFVSIISNKSLWLSDIFKSNDSSEKRYYGELLIKYLVEKYRLSDNEEAQLWGRLEDLSNPDSEHVFSYACCFSECPDLLSQWKMYADNGRGVCIGFDKDILKKVNGNIVGFDKVLYPKKVSKSIEKKLNADDMMKYFASNRMYVCMLDSLMKNAKYRKHPSFAMEKEWRIIISSQKSYCGLINIPDPIDEIGDAHCFYGWRNDLFGILGPKVCVKNNNIRTYFELDFSKVSEQLIKKVVIGPNSTLAPIDIYSVLLSAGYVKEFECCDFFDKSRFDKVKRCVTVSRSQVPYRG